MRRSRIIITMLIVILFLAGCIETGRNKDFDDDQDPRWEPFTYQYTGEEYLEEFESMVIFTLDLNIGEHLVNMTAFVSWYDEPPDDRVREYENYGDQFTVFLKDGNLIHKIHTCENVPGFQGNVNVYHVGSAFDRDIHSEPTTTWVEVTLDYAGDQYSKSTPNEQTKIEDDGNAFSWLVTYTIIREMPADE
jgi:hypothetical protein